MSDCRRLRFILSEVADGEADPTESLLVARHLTRCTPCRIRLARERHLASMIDDLDDRIPVEEAFLEGVMRSLPETPPPPARSRRGLKLAGVGMLLLAGAGALARMVTSAPGPVTLLPRLDLSRTGDFLEVLATIGRFVGMILDRAGASVLPDPVRLDLHAHIGTVAILPAAAMLLTLSALCALVYRCRQV